MRFAVTLVLIGLVGCGGGSEDDDQNSGDSGIDAATDGDDGIDAPLNPDALPDAEVPMGYHSIATARAFSCELTEDGIAKCWGSIGNSITAEQFLTPHAYGATMHFRQLTAAGENICGVTVENLGYCWGPNGAAQLGTGAVNQGSTMPQLVGTGRLFSKLFAGGETACGINAEDIGFCWGDTRYGQVGADVTSPNGVHSPTMVQGPPGMTMKFIDMSVSADFACGITTAKAMFCWGSNFDGQLGIGGAVPNNHTTDANVATASSSAMQWSRVATGATFTCALTTQGVPYCWGKGAGYQLGTGTTTSSTTPAMVAGNHLFTDLDAGADWACGVTAAGELWCWGANALGQAASATNPLMTPTRVATNLAFSDISASDGQHACGATLAGEKVYCWGRNDFGQHGNGTTSPAATANVTPVEVTQ